MITEAVARHFCWGLWRANCIVLLQDKVVIVHSAFSNKSVRLLPGLLVMARAYKAAGADLMFVSADAFSLRFSEDWLKTNDAPKLFFLPSGSNTPQQLEGEVTVAAAVSFINSKLTIPKHRIEAPHEEHRTVSDPIPETNDGPVKQVVADNFDELVLNSNKVV